jgi:3-methyladenine DNA glycosylase AlkD
MNAQEILDRIRPLGKESYKRVIMRHGAREPVYGASIEDMKKVVKGIRKDYALAKELYASGVYDAMYLAGLIADDGAMTKDDLQTWVRQAYCPGLFETTVPWVAAGSRFGTELADLWIEDPDPRIAAAGWATYCSLVVLKPDEELDLVRLSSLLDRVGKTVQAQSDRVRYCMNSFVSAVGAGVAGLTDLALRTSDLMGPVSVVMEGTSCKVRSPQDMIAAVRERGLIGRKRKTVKC